MKILVINSGSSSLKFELIDMTNEKTIAKGICERIGISNPIFTFKNLLKGSKIDARPEPMENHSVAIDIVLKTLQDPVEGVISSVDERDAIGHRVVHAGESYADSVLIDEKVIETLEEMSVLAPLHNPANIVGIKVMRELLPEKKNVADVVRTFVITGTLSQPRSYYENIIKNSGNKVSGSVSKKTD